MKTIITPEMIDSLYNMLISGNKEDRILAMGVLNNRDLRNKKSEENVEKLTNRYIEKEYPVLNEIRICDKILTTLELIQTKLKMRHDREQRGLSF